MVCKLFVVHDFSNQMKSRRCEENPTEIADLNLGLIIFNNFIDSCIIITFFEHESECDLVHSENNHMSNYKMVFRLVQPSYSLIVSIFP